MDVRKAIYAGSFDPVTYGHLDIIDRSSKIFDELIVAVGDNPRKNYLFSREERVKLLRDSISSRIESAEKVKVEPFTGLLVDYAKERGVKILVRGLRAVTDFEQEFQMALANMDLAPEIETIFMLTRPRSMPISSSFIKEIAENDGDVSRYTTPMVQSALKSKYESYK